MPLRSRTVLAVYILLSVAVGAYEAAAFSTGRETGEQFEWAWSFVALLLVIFWLEIDSREHKEIYRPFEYGFLLFLFWLFYLPYYLFRTRGAKAVLWLAGFILLSFLGYGLQWLVYIAR